MGIDILQLITNYHTSIKFFYPMVILVVLTLVITVHSRKFKKTDEQEIVHKVDLQINQTDFLNEIKLIQSGDFSVYLNSVDNDIDKMTVLIKDYRAMVKKYGKYSSRMHLSTSKKAVKHAHDMRNKCLMQILADLDSMKSLKMSIVNEEVYKEWKKKEKQ